MSLIQFYLVEWSSCVGQIHVKLNQQYSFLGTNKTGQTFTFSMDFNLTPACFFDLSCHFIRLVTTFIVATSESIKNKETIQNINNYLIHKLRLSLCIIIKYTSYNHILLYFNLFFMKTFVKCLMQKASKGHNANDKPENYKFLKKM